MKKQIKKTAKKKDEIEKLKTYRFCKDCRFYDKPSERKFRRKVGPRNKKGERTEIIELRAVCRNPKSKSYNRLVMAEYERRQCPVWEEGVYKPEGKNNRQDNAKTAPHEYHGPDLTNVEKTEME